MRNAFNNKYFLLVAGLLIGLVTLFSHSLRLEVKSGKATTEQTQEGSGKTFVIVPSDAVTVNAFAFHADVWVEIAPTFRAVEKIKTAIPVVGRTATTLFQTLFRFIISPNAP